MSGIAHATGPDESETLSILVLGDVVGRSGRKAVKQHLPGLRREYHVDLVVVNGENGAAGIGLTSTVAKELFLAGVDVITSGNHIWRHKEIYNYFSLEPRLLRPANYPDSLPGLGVYIAELANGGRVGVLNLQGRVFMEALDCPFRAADRCLENMRIGYELNALIVDFHAEATSEKMAMGWYLDGRVSAVLGTHTHIPTADHRILPKGTGYQTDIGMSGCYDSIIGMQTDKVLIRFLDYLPTRFEPALELGMVSGVLVIVEKKSGVCRRMVPIRRGKGLSETMGL
ncbi:MAG: TIGR00282 family metallophosphoesterase [Magnetococcus sp. DMHC-6]